MPGHSKLGILLLGSEPVVQSVIGETLESAGYVVHLAANLGIAVDILAKESVHLLITHPYIAEISGRDAATYLRTKMPGMPVLIVAGLPDDDRLRNWAAIDKLELFPKLFSATQLVEKVREMLLG